MRTKQRFYSFFFSQTGIVWWVKGLTNFHIRKFPNKAKLCRIVNRPPPPPHIYCHLRSYQSKFCMLMNVVIAVNNRRTFTNCRFPEELHEGIIVHVQSRSLEFAQVGFYKWKIVKKKKIYENFYMLKSSHNYLHRHYSMYIFIMHGKVDFTSTRMYWRLKTNTNFNNGTTFVLCNFFFQESNWKFQHCIFFGWGRGSKMDCIKS